MWPRSSAFTSTCSFAPLRHRTWREGRGGDPRAPGTGDWRWSRPRPTPHGRGGWGCPGPAGQGEASQESLGWLAGGPSTRSGTGGGSVGLQSVLGGVTDPVPRKGPCDAAGVSCGLTGSAGWVSGRSRRCMGGPRGRVRVPKRNPTTDRKPSDACGVGMRGASLRVHSSCANMLPAQKN